MIDGIRGHQLGTSDAMGGGGESGVNGRVLFVEVGQEKSPKSTLPRLSRGNCGGEEGT